MKKILLICLVMVMGFSANSHAVLVNNGDGTVTDLDRGLMYYDFSYRTDTWSDANSWALGLDAAGHTDWRLPSALNSDGSGPCYDPDACSDSDLGSLYYNDGISVGSQGPFDNLPLTDGVNGISYYWTETAHGSDFHYIFAFHNGRQHVHESPYWVDGFAVAVRDVEVVPEPGTMLLLGSGLAGFMGFRKKIRV